jgi:uncharacterized protein (DUF924 family)
MAAMPWDDILAFWFGELDAAGKADADHSARWWRKDPTFDETIRARFEGEHRAIDAGEREDWLADPRGRVAYVVALDQFSRNMFRGTPAMFASDARALAAAKSGVAAGEDAQLPHAMRYFLYMPYMHSEALEDQEACVELFRRLDPVKDGAEKGQAERYAEQHRDIVARFGRFPHRNAILGRASTPAEAEFLTQPGSSF